MSADPELRARDADTEYLVRRSMTKGYYLFSVLTPPAYTAFVFLRRGRGQFTINRVLRATWLGGAAGTLPVPSCRLWATMAASYLHAHQFTGLVAGGGFGYVRSVSSTTETLRARRLKAAYDVRPAIFLRRVCILSNQIHLGRILESG